MGWASGNGGNGKRERKSETEKLKAGNGRQVFEPLFHCIVYMYCVIFDSYDCVSC